jgi:hypothetical protein
MQIKSLFWHYTPTLMQRLLTICEFFLTRLTFSSMPLKYLFFKSEASVDTKLSVIRIGVNNNAYVNYMFNLGYATRIDLFDYGYILSASSRLYYR